MAFLSLIVVLSWAVLTVGRTVGSPGSMLVLVLMVSPIWTLMAGLVGAGLLLRRPADPRLWALMVLQLGLWTAIWGRAWWASPSPPQGESVRVMAWNVQRLGFEDSDEGARLRCVSDAVQQANPDLISFMEVSGRDIDRLSERLGLQCQHVDYRGTGSSKRGGLAACARAGSWKVGRAGPRRFVENGDWYFVFSEMVRQDEQQVVNLISVHLQPTSLDLSGPRSPGAVAATHNAEAAALLDRMAVLQDPSIVAGDFNSTRETPLHGALREQLVDVFEQSAWGPGVTVAFAGMLPLRVDFVYATPDLPAQGAWIPGVACSDHRPVVADIGLPEPWDRGGG